MRFLRKVHDVTLHAKSAAVKFIKPWMSSHFFESRDPSYDGSTTWLECPKKDRRSESCSQRKATRRSSKDRVVWRRLRPCLVPSWCRANKTSSDCWKSWGISSPGFAVPVILVRGKAGMKKQWMNIVSVASFPAGISPWKLTYFK